jgi:hypothetical protein
MNAAKIAAEKSRAAHARAAADQASFQARESLAAEHRAVEVANRKVMDGERERNRLRKLNALGGREWDAEKKDEEDNDGRSSSYRRGANGGVRYDGGRGGRGGGGRGGTNAGKELFDIGDGEERGDGSSFRGGRGGRGGRGRGDRGGRGRGDNFNGRGGAPQGQKKSGSSQPAIALETEFPSLPVSSAPEPGDAEKKPKPETPLAPIASPPAASGTWADQVNQSED